MKVYCEIECDGCCKDCVNRAEDGSCILRK